MEGRKEIDMWDNDEMLGDEEQVIRSASGNEYSSDDWVFCLECDEVFQIRDLTDGTDGDEGGDYCPKCGAGGLDQDIFPVDSDLASDEIREVYEQKREEREADEEDGEEEDGESAYDDDWLFDGDLYIDDKVNWGAK
jgi:hypothetical protein